MRIADCKKDGRQRGCHQSLFKSAIRNPHSAIKGGLCLMAWLYLFVAGLLEVAWAVGLKYTEGFTRLWPSVWTLAALALSMALLAAAVRTLPLGTAYAVWTGIGAVGTALL